MTGNILGEKLALASFGESHGRCIGMVLDGCPAGLPLSESDLQIELDKRKPGQSIITTQRKEEDRAEILSGVFNGYTTSAPICAVIWNKDSDSRPYDVIKNSPRPGHADYPSFIKYGGFADYRGSGRFSGRLTATMVMGGAIAQKLLKYALGIETIAYTTQIGTISYTSSSFEDSKQNRYANEVRCPDSQIAQKMKAAILDAKKDGDSLGGIVESLSVGLPVGLGEPIFSSLESDLSKALFSIPSVKAIEFGSGFSGTKLRGSENNDEYVISDGNKVTTETNNSGGILGGLSNGMPLVIRVGFKPASSIAKKQKTIDLASNTECEIVVPGRHDPCVVPRAIPVVESLISLVLADHAIRWNLIPPVLSEEKK
ncbi:MAG TPA: chorismate synthase [Nitrososphaeraceae archaeon]|jgi:chorismate synthase